MKQKRRIIQIIASCLFAVVAVFASLLVIRYNKIQKENDDKKDMVYDLQDVPDTNINFTLSSNSSYYIVTGFSAPLTALTGNDRYCLNIPEEYNGLPVKEINIPLSSSSTAAGAGRYPLWIAGATSFGVQRSACLQIASVVVPKTVEKISEGAFNTFHSVEEMVLPFIGTERGNTAATAGYRSSIYGIFGDNSFQAQRQLNYNVTTNGAITDIDSLPSGSGMIPWYDTLGTSIDHGDGGSGSSTPATAKNVVVPGMLSKITITDEYSVANHAFFMMLPLQELSISFSNNIPSTVEGANSIGERAFDTAANMTTAYLPDSIGTLRAGAFCQCYALKTVLPQSRVAAYESNTLVGNASNNQVIAEYGIVFLPLDGNTNATIPDDTFYNCINIANVVISTEVRSIGRYAFANCSSILRVMHSRQLASFDFTSNTHTNEIPANVESIGDFAFRSCFALRNMTIGTNLKTMGSGVFNACGSLQSLTIPFIGKERGNGTTNPSACYTDGTVEALFGYIFGEYGQEDGAYKKVFQATTANPAERDIYAGLGTGGGGSTSPGTSPGVQNVPFAEFYIPVSLKSVTITDESLIAIGAFMNCSMIENLQIYSFVEDANGLSTTEIGRGALAGCTGLTTLSIPFVGRYDINMSQDTLFNGRGASGYQLGYIFGIYNITGCEAIPQGEPFSSSPTIYYIPSSLTSIELNHQSYVPSYAFWKCSHLNTVIIGDETKGIQRSMFMGCQELVNLTVPFVGVQRGYVNRDVKWYFWWHDIEIRNSLVWFFSQSSGNEEYLNTYITSWTNNWICYVPEKFENVTVTQENYYQTNAFQGFRSLKRVTIKAIEQYTDMYIESGIMNGCSNIEEIDIPFIGATYNRNQSSSASFTIGWLFGTASYGNSYLAYQSTGGNTTGFYIPKGLTTITLDRYFTRIADGAFRNMTSLEQVINAGERAANVTYMGAYAFANCYNLDTVTFEKASYTAMGDGAFLNCVSLSVIDAFSPLTVTRIGHHALEGTSISVIDFSRYRYLGDYAFANCLQLTQVDMYGQATTYATTNTTGATNFDYVGTHLFAGCTNLTDVILKHTTTGANGRDYVSEYMFQNCTSLETIDLDPAVSTVIPNGLFDGCSKLGDNSVPGTGLGLTANASHIERIGANAFRGCRTMKTLALPENLKTIAGGAFQNCSNLDSLRIPRDCSIIPAGSDFNQTPVFDDYVNGVFYGCNEDKFYLEVYHAEDDWPVTWGTNWNCYFPVYIIGDQSENLFTYEYCPTLKGYLITGFNEEVDFAPNGNLLLNGTLKFPNTHDGLIVYGLTDSCFSAEKYYVDAFIDGTATTHKVHPLFAVDTLILGANFVSLGNECLTFNNYSEVETMDDTTVYRTVFSQKTAAEAMAATGTVCDCTGTIHANRTNELNGLCYDDEVTYINNGIVYYKDVWQFKTITANGSTVNTMTPVFKINALTFTLDSSSFQYQLGEEIKPKIIAIDVDDRFVKYSTNKEDFRLEGEDTANDQLYFMFYDYDGTLDLASFYLTYFNNVNVGNGQIKIRSNNSRLLGETEINFSITKRRIDLFYQSGQHSDLYGGTTQSDGYSYLDHVKFLVMTGQKKPLFYNPNTALLNNLTIVTQEYTGERWENSRWSAGGNVFGIPNDYVFTGTLSTVSADSGYYMAYNNAYGDTLLSEDYAEMVSYPDTFAANYYSNTYPSLSGAGSIASAQVGSINGFQWTTAPKITYKGANVTGNFEVVINYALLIAKRVVSTPDDLDWGGYYNETTGLYEYEYNGGYITPTPMVIDRKTDKKINASIRTEVAPERVIYPTNAVHTSTIKSYDTRNFYIDLGISVNRYNYIQFIVVKAKLKIVYNCTQFTIDEFGQNFTYNFTTGKVEQGKVTGQSTLQVTKLAPTDYISGTFYSVNENGEDWEEGTYRSKEYADGKKIVHDLKIFSSTLKTTSGEPVEMTEYYDLAECLDAVVRIIYNEFEYDFTVTYENLANTDGLSTLNGVYTLAIPSESKNYVNEAFGIHHYNSSQSAIEMTFGVDGYMHDFSVKIKNATDTTPTTLGQFDDGTGNGAISYFTVTDFEKMQYVYTLTISKARYYTVTKTVTVTPVKGNYFFGDISKEYDREEAEPLSKILRLPKDFDPSKISFKFYNRNDWLYNNEISAPIEVGEYKFTATTEINHSEFFNDLLEWPRDELNISLGDFSITKRSIYIDVIDQTEPFDSKHYDGLPWKANYENATNQTHTALNLLDGDVFNGFFMSRSAEIGVYNGDVNGDFILASAQPWTVTNTSLPKQNQTSNYRIVYRGSYEILPLVIKYGFNETQTFIYDGLYHTVDVTVTEPVFGATVYYSESSIPVDGRDWKAYPPQYSAPGTYTIYFKIEAPHYQTVMNSAVIIIEGRDIHYRVDGEQHAYDGFSHGIVVTPTDPVTASVGYCLLDGTENNLTPEDYSKLSYSSNCPQVINIGTYQYAVRLEHPNYNPTYIIVTMVIENTGDPHNVYVTGYEGFYDGLYHGPIINLSGAVQEAGAEGENLLITYHEGGMNVANPTWTTASLTIAEDGTRYLSIYRNAMPSATKVTVRILLRNFAYYEQEVEIFIKNRTLSLTVENYRAVFDNEYHTVLLKALDPNHTLVVTNELKENGTITYRYYFGKDDPSTPENELENIPYEILDVRYHENPNVVINSNLKMLKYKNVCYKQVFLYVMADNCNPRQLDGTVEILFNDDPLMEFPTSDMEIEYLARPVTLEDLEFTTVHDGVPTIKWYNRNNLSNPIAAPTALGSYYVRVEYPATTNCAAKSAYTYFTIVPRFIDITYDKELQYNGQIQTPDLVVDTHTTDTVLLGKNVRGGVQPIEIGDYEMDVFFRIEDPNYRLREKDKILDFKIVPRKLIIKIDEVYQATVPMTNWIKNSDWDNSYITGLLATDSIQLELETEAGYVDTYYNYDVYRVDSASGNYELYDTLVPPAGIYYANVLARNIYITHQDEQGNLSFADYYEIIFEVKVSIEYPPLEVEVHDAEYAYDGNPKTVDIDIISSGVQTILTEFYYVDDENKNTFNQFLEINVGVYKVHYKISTDDGLFKPAEGEATLTINKVNLDFSIDPFDVVYDGKEHNIGYTFTDPNFHMPTTITPRFFYFDVEELKALRVTHEQLDRFFREGMPTTSRIYSLYNDPKTSKPRVNAGTFIAYAYFPESNNWYTSFRSAEVTLKKRPLYFDYTGVPAPLIIEFDYTGQKPKISMGGFVYDESFNSLNNGPNAGLLPGHSMVRTDIPTFLLSPNSPDCRGEANNPGYEDPYQFDGDFEFASAYIAGADGNVAYNYYPAVNPIEDERGNLIYQVQIIIRRIQLTSFEVLDTEMEYNGEDAIPEILTPSDGKLIYYYYKVKDSISDITDTSNYFYGNQVFEHQKDVSQFSVNGVLEDGYYLVFITISDGRNFYAWNGGASGTDYTTDTLNGSTILGGDYENRKYKHAYVKVVPKQAQVLWKSLEEEFDVDEDGKAIRYTMREDIHPYIIDVYGNEQPINASMISAQTGATVAYAAAAGSYYVSATLDGTIINPLNYILNYPNDVFKILPKEYTIYERLTEPYLLTYWHKDYTKEDFGDEWIHSAVDLELEVRTRVNQAGFFYRANDFVLTQKITDAVGDDYSDSIHFNLNYSLYLTSNELIIEATDATYEYDRTVHGPIINVTSHMNGYYIRYDVVMVDENGDYFTSKVPGVNYTIDYKYSYPGDNYMIPDYENDGQIYKVFNSVGRYRVFYQVTLGDPDSVETVSQKTGMVDVTIKLADPQLYFADTGLDREYNGLAPSEAEVKSNLASGRYNGTSNDLVIKYYQRNSTTEIPAPITVGLYTVRVTSAVDDDPTVVKNYGRLNASYDFEIYPRKVTLMINANWEVTDADLNDQNLIWVSKAVNSTSYKNVNGGVQAGSEGYDFTIMNSFNQTNSDYYIPIPGLVVSDYFVFRMNSLQHLERGTYKFRGSSAYNSDFTFTAERTLNGVSEGSYDFDCKWLFKYDDQNGDPSDDELKTENYNIILDFTLVVHYKYMNHDLVSNMTYDYDTTIQRSPYANITYHDPSEADSTTYYRRDGEGPGTYNTDVTQYLVTEPGVYNYYIKITAPEYEDWEGRTSITINYRQRDKDTITIDPQYDLGKTYDGIPYDSSVLSPSSDLLCHFQWNQTDIVGGEILPAVSSWKIEYFLAHETTGDRVGDALESVVDAGRYWYRLTIPAGTIYGPTEIERPFRISPREYKIYAHNYDPWIEVGYNSNIWSYDIAKNPDNYIIETQSGTSGLLTGHYISVGVIETSGSNVGDYTISGSQLTINSGDGTNYRILDANGNNVRSNYIYSIEFDLRIKKGTIQYTEYIEDQYEYIGSGENDYYSPYIDVTLPANGNAYVEYSKTGLDGTWSKELPRYQDVGTYYIYYRALNVPNYNDLEPQCKQFEIVKKTNTLEIADLTRQYNGNPIEDPLISTANISSMRATMSDPLINTIVWEKEVSGGWVTLSSKPIEVGHYKVSIAINPTANYNGIGNWLEFDITPLVVSLTWSKKEFEYAAIPQAPDYELRADDYPEVNVMGLLAHASAANQFEVTYYDVSTGAQLPGKPTNVGEYRVQFAFQNEGLDYYTFSKDSSVSSVATNFTINKRKVTVKLGGNMEAPAGASVIQFTTATVDNLPDPVEFDGILIRQSVTAGTDKINGKYTDSAFTTMYKFSGPSADPKFMFKGTTTADQLSNYDIYVEINQSVSTGQFTYNIEGFKGEYDGKDHHVKFEPIAPEGDVTSVLYSMDGGSTWQSDLPQWSDASSIPHYVQIKVRSQIHGEVILGANAVAEKDERFAVIIYKKKTILNGDNVSLGKVYDGIAIKNPIVNYNKQNPDENRDAALQYNYFLYVEDGAGGGTYEPIGDANIVNAGKYRLIISMADTTNYEGTDATAGFNTENGPLEIFFEIKKRPIAIVYKNGQKDYDGLRWQETIRSMDGEVLPITNDPNSGLVDGHVFNGTIQTIASMAGLYNISSQFEWLDEYSIFDGDLDVRENYELHISVDARISKLTFKVDAISVKVPWDGNPHHISIVWREVPKIQDIDQNNLESLIKYSLSENGPFDQTRIDVINAGLTTIYFRIEGPNYDTHNGHATVELTPRETVIQITDFPGNGTGYKEYDGQPYPIDKIFYELSVDPDRLVTYTFYEVIDGQPDRELVDPPVEVGHYYFIANVGAGPTSDAARSGEYHFRITKHTEPYRWEYDSLVTLENGVPTMTMIYKGENTPVKPSAYFIDVFDHQIPANVIYTDAQGNPITPSNFTCGYYYVKAELDPTHPKYQEYIRNYNFTDEFQPFKIVGQIAGTPDGSDPTGGDEADPDYAGITFPSPQGDPRNNQADYDAKALVKDGKLYITAIKHFFTKPDKTVVYTVDLESGEILEVDGIVLSSTTTPNFKFVLPKDDQGKTLITTNINHTPTFTIHAQLLDKINTRWDTNDDVADKPIDIKIEATELDPDHTTHDPYPEPNGTDVQDIIIDPYDHTQYWNGVPVTFPLTVRVTQGTVDQSDDEILIEDVDYKIEWYRNTGVTPEDDPSQLASFTIKSIDGRKYSFRFGDDTTMDNTKHAGTFSIINSQSQRLKIRAGSKYKFVYYQQDLHAIDPNLGTEIQTLTMDILDGVENTSFGQPKTRDEVLDACVDQTELNIVTNKIRLGHTHQYIRPEDENTPGIGVDGYREGQLGFVLEQLDHKKDELKIWAYLDDGTGTNTKTLQVVFDLETGVELYNTPIATGMHIALFKSGQSHTNDNELDAIDVVLHGDINCDGAIDIFDVNEMLIDLPNVPEYIDNDDPIIFTVQYQAGLLAEKTGSAQPVQTIFDVDVLIMSAADVQLYDINAAFKQTTQQTGN
ncbi:MAG: leucine-rich repeat domain-containing protein [Anaeroplasmataceae bacterium]|nr:leucine-rich repeat domain-containing protein [Anaeroplasmataceae bacterium]